MDVKTQQIESMPYATPCLTVLGSVSELTASGSLGNIEPGCTTDCFERRSV